MGSAAYPAFPVGHLGFRATSEQKDNAKCVKKAVWDYINRLRIDEGYERREQHDASFLATAENVINAFAGYRVRQCAKTHQHDREIYRPRFLHG